MRTSLAFPWQIWMDSPTFPPLLLSLVDRYSERTHMCAQSTNMYSFSHTTALLKFYTVLYRFTHTSCMPKIITLPFLLFLFCSLSRAPLLLVHSTIESSFFDFEVDWERILLYAIMLCMFHDHEVATLSAFVLHWDSFLYIVLPPWVYCSASVQQFVLVILLPSLLSRTTRNTHVHTWTFYKHIIHTQKCVLVPKGELRSLPSFFGLGIIGKPRPIILIIIIQ